jgi:hypothetical protein
MVYSMICVIDSAYIHLLFFSHTLTLKATTKIVIQDHSRTFLASSIIKLIDRCFFRWLVTDFLVIIIKYIKDKNNKFNRLKNGRFLLRFYLIFFIFIMNFAHYAIYYNDIIHQVKRTSSPLCCYILFIHVYTNLCYNFRSNIYEF